MFNFTKSLVEQAMEIASSNQPVTEDGKFVDINFEVNDSSISSNEYKFKHQPLKTGLNILRTAGLADEDSAKFGMTRVRADGSKRAHQGVDLAIPPGYKCYAVDDGKVVKVYNGSGLGLTLIIKLLNQPYYAVYSHLSSTKVPVGEFVKAGDVVALSGFSGNASNMDTIEKGSHLHFEVRTKVDAGFGLANRVDPLSFFDLDPKPTGDHVINYA